MTSWNSIEQRDGQDVTVINNGFARIYYYELNAVYDSYQPTPTARVVDHWGDLNFDKSIDPKDALRLVQEVAFGNALPLIPYCPDINAQFAVVGSEDYNSGHSYALWGDVNCSGPGH